MYYNIILNVKIKNKKKTNECIIIIFMDGNKI